jgi:hypothetical protein
VFCKCSLLIQLVVYNKDQVLTNAPVSKRGPSKENGPCSKRQDQAPCPKLPGVWGVPKESVSQANPSVSGRSPVAGHGGCLVCATGYPANQFNQGANTNSNSFLSLSRAPGLRENQVVVATQMPDLCRGLFVQALFCPHCSVLKRCTFWMNGHM